MPLSHKYLFIEYNTDKKTFNKVKVIKLSKNKYLNYQPSVFYKEAFILINVHIFLMNAIAAKKER